MPSFKMPTPIKRPTSAFYWIRKKVPERLRDVVGKTEIWASLRTKDQRKAAIKIGAVNAAIEAEWACLRRGEVTGSGSGRAPEPEPFKVTHQDLHALRGEEHVRIRDQWSEEPPAGLSRLRITAVDEESLQLDAIDLLEKGGYDASMENIERLAPLLMKARREAAQDVEHARRGEYEKISDLTKMPLRTTPALDLIKAFEEYVDKGSLKGGKIGPTAKRWRPKIRAFCDWLGHRDLKRVTSKKAYEWVDHLIEKKFDRESIKKVWIASLSAVAGYMVERRALDNNPFLRIKVRPQDPSENDEEEIEIEPRTKGYSLEEAKAILTATLAEPSHLISVEMRAARRWLPWLCAYSGARVNELTSLYSRDVIPDKASGIWCMVIKPSREKTKQRRLVPIHSHVIAQGFLEYVEQRRNVGKPLFYDPQRSRGGKPGNPQFKKVAERLSGWLHGLDLIPNGIQPNHGWRHLFKSMARHLKMDREVEGFITGHRPKGSTASEDYGDRWVATMAAEIEKYPRFEIPALNAAPNPHKRVRRTNAEVAAAKAAKEKRKALRSTTRA